MDRPIRVIGAPMDLGANRRGVDMGPSAIRYAGLDDDLAALGLAVEDAGDLLVPRAEERDPDAGAPPEGEAKFLREVEDLCSRLANQVAETLAAGTFPLVLGGDHSITIGTGVGAARDREIGLLWVDAHADINTPATSPSGNVHGMPLAALLGHGYFADRPWANAPGIEEENVAYVGLRSVDDGERELIRQSDITAFTMADIDERGITPVMEDALDVVAGNTDGIHVSVDVDVVDPKAAPGVGTPVRGGLTYREAHTAMELVAARNGEEGLIRSLDVVEVNPILDRENETAALASELIESAMGKQIL